jgi:rhodanese-related sulfurtransferase
MSAAVKRMNVQKFDEILKSGARSRYQIIDVREKAELDAVSIPGDDVIQLPLSEANTWSQEVLDKKLLDPEKPTLCLCHMGVRSMQVASFLCKFLRCFVALRSFLYCFGQCCLTLICVPNHGISMLFTLL